MKSILLVLLVIPMCFLTFIGGAIDTSDIQQITEVTEETVTDTVYPTEVYATVPNTEPTIPEITFETELTMMESPVTKVEATELMTDSTEYDKEMRSLGSFKLTAYCPCQKCCGSYALNRPVDENGNMIVYGSTGVRLESGVSIAVDPHVIPYGTQVVINGHTYTAQDTGGSIQGNRIDVYFDDHQEAWDFGTQYAEVFISVSSD